MARQAKPFRKSDVVLWLRLARVYRRLAHAANQHIREHGLTPAQFDVIAQSGATPGLTQEQLARRLFVTEGNVTQLLGRMEKVGLIQRERDARCNRVRLTDEGKQLYESVVPVHEEYMAGQFDGLTVAEREQLGALLRTLDRSQRPK